MELFRIAKCLYIRDLSGKGAERYGGRWNSKGLPVVYASGSRALAALEALVHVPLKNITADYCMAVLSVPDQVRIRELTVKDLPEGWELPACQERIQETGNDWSRRKEYCLLRVPSAIIEQEWNYLINPLHPDARKIRISFVEPFHFDKRLKQ